VRARFSAAHDKDGIRQLITGLRMICPELSGQRICG
jgi:hypothetical protein